MATDELAELQAFAMDPQWKPMVMAVLNSAGCATVRVFFQKYPDQAFELHEEICLLAGDVAGVGEFEHTMEREIM